MSKNTNTEWLANAATKTCGTVSASSQAATGIEARIAAFAKSATTITRLRSNRSASAPATRPNSR